MLSPSGVKFTRHREKDCQQQQYVLRATGIDSPRCEWQNSVYCAKRSVYFRGIPHILSCALAASSEEGISTHSTRLANPHSAKFYRVPQVSRKGQPNVIRQLPIGMEFPVTLRARIVVPILPEITRVFRNKIKLKGIRPKLWNNRFNHYPGAGYRCSWHGQNVHLWFLSTDVNC